MILGQSKLREYKKKLKEPLRQATLVFLFKENRILLAMKKRGFAEGKWNGAGGKMDRRDSNIREAAIRETREEIGIVPTSLKKVATINFYHLNKEDYGQQVTVYLCDNWEGELVESDEMAPKWFKLDEIPYEKMWIDDKIWMPMILANKTIKADFLFDENQKMLDKDICEVDSI